MKKIALISPDSTNSVLESGISIRLQGLSKWLKEHNFKPIIVYEINNKVLESSKLFYALISTKENSNSHKLLKKLKPDQRLIIDLYTPLFLEKEAGFSVLNPSHLLQRQKNKMLVKKMLARGDHFIVANRRQKKYWLNIADESKVNINDKDISVIFTGAPKINVKKLPITRRKVILWFGGIYPWLDLKPLIEAFSQIAPKYPRWKLRILGGFHPKTGYIKLYDDFVNLAQKKINENQIEIIPWQKLSDIGRYLSDVAFAVHLVKNMSEDFYAHRVRLLTLTDAGIPFMTNGRDIISHHAIKLMAMADVRNNKKTLEDKIKILINKPRLFYQWSKFVKTIDKKVYLERSGQGRFIRFLNSS